MLRYADTHNLTVGLPLEGKWELGGYPAYIDRRLIDPQLPTYNILGHHFRFNIDKLREFMPTDTKYAFGGCIISHKSKSGNGSLNKELSTPPL